MTTLLACCAPHTAALTLLPNYIFDSQVFEPAHLASLRRLRDLCLTYNV